jgi:WbqC-like protein family
MQVALFATAYFPSVEYVHYLLKFPQITVEAHEYFPKQTNRNRCHFLGPNGVQSVFIPLVQTHAKTLAHDVQIDFSVDWKTTHWRSFETAYNRSAFFEFYKDELSDIFFRHETFLLPFNLSLLQFVLVKLKQPRPIQYTQQFELTQSNDWRKLSNKKNKELVQQDYYAPKYQQVFGYRQPFVQNLSVLDLLFNCGREAINYLNDEMV